MTPARSLPFLAWSLLLLTACAGPSSPDTASPPPTVGPDAPAAAPVEEPGEGGAYTEEQAGRGRTVFRATCSECHYSSEFRSSQFRFKWRRRTAGDLFEHMVETMPEDDPGSLEPQQYADVLAYILQMNDLPAGSAELPADPAVLEAVSLAAFSRDEE